MTDRAEDGATTFRERVEESRINRRLLLLLLVIFLVILGSGIGTIIFSGPSPPPADDETTPTPTPVPPTETATANPGSATPSDTATPSETPADGTDVPGTPENNRGSVPSDGGSSTPTPSPGLELGDDGPLLEAANLAPGSADTGEMTVRNAADEDGTLTVSRINITDDENGITDAEESVDTSPGEGELSSHLEVRLSIQDAAGNEEYLFGTDSGYETLGNLSTSESSGGYHLESGETVTLVADWQLPTSTGNVVQSDRVLVDLGLTLESVSS